MDRIKLSILGFTGLIFAGVLFVLFTNPNNDPDRLPRELCVQHQGLGMHIHPVLQIFNGDQLVPMPADLGIAPECMKAIHTHDASGTIHLEYPDIHDFVLGDFFTNWGQPFSSTQVMDMTADATHQITLTVDGQPSTEFENLVMKDKQQIVIRYETK